MTKYLTETEKLHIAEKAKLALLRVEKHLDDALKKIRAEIEDVISEILKLQTNGVNKTRKKERGKNGTVARNK